MEFKGVELRFFRGVGWVVFQIYLLFVFALLKNYALKSRSQVNYVIH